MPPWDAGGDQTDECRGNKREKGEETVGKSGWNFGDAAVQGRKENNRKTKYYQDRGVLTKNIPVQLNLRPQWPRFFL